MLNAPFQPQSKSFIIDENNTVQVTTLAGNGMQYRIRNIAAAVAWISWGGSVTGGGAPTLNTTQPIAGTPQSGIIGMAPGITETFTLPPGCWFKASAGATFEVIAGEGV